MGDWGWYLEILCYARNKIAGNSNSFVFQTVILPGERRGKDGGKKENTRSGKFNYVKRGGVEGHGQNRSKWPKIFAGTLFQHFITDSPSG